MEQMVERLRELILEDDEALAHVMNTASDSLAHIEKVYGPIENAQVREELLCQYQVRAWTKLFSQIGEF